MPSWTARTLAEVVTLQRGHDLPATQRGDGPVPVIGSFGITGLHDVARYRGPGVAIGRSGASIGTATYCTSDYWPLNTCLFVKDFLGNDPRWVFYLLDSIDFSGYNSGSAQPSLNRNFLAKIPVALPPLAEQRRIAATLGALDDKIESNRKLRQIMWDFLAAEYRQLSADSESVELRQLLSLEYGKSLPAAVRVSGRVPVYGSNGITGYHDKELIPGPGVIVGRKGSIGEVHWTHAASFPIDTTFYVSPMSGYALLACYFALKNAELRDKNSDSAIPGLNREAALGTRVLAPTLEVAQNWSASRQEILGHVHHLDRENVELTSLRDALLPELLSGSIRVPEAREAVQEVVA